MKDLRVYYLANIRYPTEKAHGIQTSKMCESFGRAVKEVRLVVPQRRNDPRMKSDPFTLYGLERRFSIVRLPTIDLIGFKLFQTFAFSLQSSTFLISVFSYLFFKSRRNVLIYTRELECAVVARILGFRSVLELHSLPRTSGILYRWALRCASSLIAISRGIARELVNRGYLGRVFTVPDGVDVERFSISATAEQARKEFGLSPSVRYGLYSGHLYAWKGIDTILDAALIAPEVIYCLAGGTDADLAEVGSRLQRRGIRNVKLLGHFEHTRVPLLLHTADILILPNTAGDPLAARFTSPLKLFEYMASGVPIVAADVPAIREIADDSMVFFFKADNGDDLARVVRDVMARPDDASKRAQAASSAVKQYSWDRRADSILKEVYHHA